MCTNLLTVSAITVIAEETGLCEHHPVHTAECGYAEAVEGVPCTHICGDECAVSCIHTAHDELCNYVEAVTGSPCEFECNDCAVTEVIGGECGEQGNNLTWTFDNGTLTISGKGTMANFTPQNLPWKDYKNDITTVVIESGVTSIGDTAFSLHSNITSVTIPDSVTSIGASALYGCEKLTGITIPDSVTSIGYYAFGFCTSLASITIPDSVTSIGGTAFYYCKSLTSVTIPDSVTFIDYSTFGNCTGLTSVTIPSSVTSINSYAFENCTSLAIVNAPCTWDTENPLYTFDENVEVITDHIGTATCVQAATCEVCGTDYFAEHKAESSELFFDETGHWYTCSCGEKIDFAEHSGGTASCTEKAVCDICEHEYGDFFHSNIYEEWFFDTTHHFHVCITCNEKLDRAEHYGGTKTCSQLAECEACGEKYGELAEHNWAEKWTFGIDTHWHRCTNEGCYQISPEESHDFDEGVVLEEATEESYGSMMYTCKVCKYNKFEYIPKLEHVHKPSEEWASDETGHWYTCSCEEKLDFAEHTEDEGTFIEATETENAAMVYKCKECEYILRTEIIPSFEIITQPTDFTGKIGDTAKFTVEADGENLTYQWEQDTGKGWTAINTTAGRSKTFSIGVAQFRLGYVYRCVVSDGTNEITSDEVQMILN